jgi:anti-sigma factor RsiW
MTAVNRTKTRSARPPTVTAPRPATAAPCPSGVDLWAYLDGELTVAGARVMARHVGACAACGPQARRLRAMLEACRSAGCQQLPRDVRARARARVRALLRGQNR